MTETQLSVSDCINRSKTIIARSLHRMETRSKSFRDDSANLAEVQNGIAAARLTLARCGLRDARSTVPDLLAAKMSDAT